MPVDLSIRLALRISEVQDSHQAKEVDLLERLS